MSAPVTIPPPPHYEVVPADNAPQSTDDSPDGGGYIGLGVPIIPKLGTGGLGIVFEGLGTVAPRLAFGIHVGASLLGGGDASPGAASFPPNGYEIDALLIGELLAYEHDNFRAFVELGAGVMKTKPAVHDGYEVVDGDAISLALAPTLGIELGRIRATVAYAFRPASTLAVTMPPAPAQSTWSSLHFVICAITVRFGGVPAGH